MDQRNEMRKEMNTIDSSRTTQKPQSQSAAKSRYSMLNRGGKRIDTQHAQK